MRAVYARRTAAVSLPSGAVVGIQQGTHWPADDPVVKANPDMFSDDPRHGMLFSRPLQADDYPDAPVVEQATAAPGERRNVRRG
jgi:hypothetical protein